MARVIFRLLAVLVLLLTAEAAVPHRLEQEHAPNVVIRNEQTLRYAKHYGISYRLAELIVRYADRWGIPHRIAFRLVKRESRFDSMALNQVSTAAGLTQVVTPTARLYDPDIVRSDLLDPEVGLDIGFRFLHMLNRRYRGDWWRSLVAYHDGPAVADTLEYGFHSYADAILLYPEER